MKTTLLLIISFLLSSCAVKYVKFAERENDIYPSDKLKAYLKNNPNPKVVIRVNDSKTKVISGTYSQQNTGGISEFGIYGGKTNGASNFVETEISNDNLYNIMEKELMKAGFLVRDRHLFNQITSYGENNIDYSVLKDKTDTDIIIEVSRLDNNILFETNKYYTDKGKEGLLSYDYKRFGALAEFKVIIIEDNELSGTYTFYYAPCSSEFPCIINADFENNWNKIKKGKRAYESVSVGEAEKFIKSTISLIHSMKY